MLRVINTSILTGKEHAMLLPVTQEQIDRWQGGELVQDVFPHLDDSQREFLVNGITPEEWGKAFNALEEKYGHD